MNANIFIKKIEIAEAKKSGYEKISNNLSLLRLVSFITLIVFVILYFIYQSNHWLLGSLLALFVFIYLIAKHNKVSIKIRYFGFLIQTLNEYLYRFDNRWQSFEDGGIDFEIDDSNVFLEDLDIVGDVSLFKYLNICKTINARKKLLQRLSNPKLEKDVLLEKQQSMKEISENIDFSLELQVALKEFSYDSPKVNLSKAIKSLSTKIKFNNIHLIIAYIFILAFTLILFFAILNIVSWLYLIFIISMQLMYSFVYQSINRKNFNDINDTATVISSLENVFKIIEQTNFQNDELNNLKNNVIYYGVKVIKDINRIKEVDSYRLNFITYFFLNGIFSLNIFIVLMYRNYQVKFGNNISKGLEALEEFEVLTSLAILGQTKQDICLPNYIDDVKLSFSKLKHPLLSEDKCVDNSFDSQSKVSIITGSNMSGKTFFLRTIGINLILMNAGAFVNSKAFTSSYLKVFTSMRIADNISKGISTFYAEILRVKNAIQYSERLKPMIVFIDEVFKGTNSNDRIQGAISMIEKLSKENVILIITTHDFELCSITSVDVKNYHFAEFYEGDKIKFDFLLKEGRCMTTNAVYLMKLAKIMD